MNRTELADIAADMKGQLITVHYTDGTDLTVVVNGNVNTKGLVVRHHADEPVFYIAPTKIQGITVPSGADDESGNVEDNMVTMDDDDELTGDEDFGYDGDEADDAETDEEIYAQLGDGMTTSELAAHLSGVLNTELSPKELRVHLRALGLGVGKGRKYSLTATEFRMVRDLINS